jgi:hypothetical protein
MVCSSSGAPGDFVDTLSQSIFHPFQYPLSGRIDEAADGVDFSGCFIRLTSVEAV